MQEVLKQKNKVKKPKTFGAVNNAYEIYHLVHKAITDNRCLYRGEITALDITFWYKSWRNGILKSSKCRRSVFMIDKYFHMIYDNIVQINNRCYVLITK